ncbi:MAG: hypothetical protein UZ09_BCD002000448 [Bacteroidetes bacterium OLB9]|nr:MAG: hypothetical protein UZ09_BCD002000448 [Bacteroidetes bacterium OLB9]
MKQFPLLLILVTSMLIGYGYFAFSSIHTFRAIIGLAAFFYSAITLYTSFAEEYETTRIKTVIGFTGVTFLIIGLITLILVAVYTNTLVWIILPLGLMLMLYLSVIYFISKSGQ